MQSVSKPFTYALGLNELGSEVKCYVMFYVIIIENKLICITFMTYLALSFLFIPPRKRGIEQRKEKKNFTYNSVSLL